MAIDLAWGRAFTAEDLAAMPDDGRRRELIHGTLVVTPAPSRRHQRAVVELVVLFHAACGPEQEVLVAPLDFQPAPDTVLEPDVLVARRDDVGEARIERAPLLVVEVLSPSTRLVDLGTKRLVFEAAGVPVYWLVDPAEPRLTVLELEAGRYVERASVIGDEAYAATHPFPVTVVPTRLVAG